MKYTNNFNLPSSMVDLINNLTYDITKSDPLRIGVTSLLNAPRIQLLRVRHWNELTEDVSEHLWRITGNAYHYILAKTKSVDKLLEEKLIENVEGVTLVGKLDLYDDVLKSVEDYKITSVFTLKFNDKQEWEEQLNCYAWLLRKAKFEVKELFINLILRDWRKNEALKNNDYPKIPFKRVKITLWDFEKQDAFIKAKVLRYKDALHLSDNELPLCTSKERWRKEDSWAVMKKGKKRAERVLDTEEKAKVFLSNCEPLKSFSIQKRTGGDLRCQEYCQVNKFCPYWKENYERKKS